jgi:hypothetical protein
VATLWAQLKDVVEIAVVPFTFWSAASGDVK